MGQVIKINPRSTGTPHVPEDLFALRWRIEMKDGFTVHSAWTPEDSQPSITRTLEDFRGRMKTLFIEGLHRTNREHVDFVTFPAAGLAGLTYKAGFMLSTPGKRIIGIEIEATDGQRFLVMTDGHVNHYIPGKS